MNNEELLWKMGEWLSELERMHSRGEVRGFSIVIVRPDGKIPQYHGFRDGFGLSLLAGLDIAHAAVRERCIGEYNYEE